MSVAHLDHSKMPSDQQIRDSPTGMEDIQLHDFQDDVDRQEDVDARKEYPFPRQQVVDNLLSPTSIGPSSSSSRPSFARMHSFESIKSTNSTKSIPGSMIDEIKHEVMVNFLFREQCSAMWVGDGGGELEGVMLRKSKGNYLSCPPQLIYTTFGQACVALNVQVCDRSLIR